MDAIEKAYQLINEPIDANLKVPFELQEIVDYKDAEPGETVEYFNTDHSGVDGIYEADANGSLTYHKITLRTPVALTFQGLQSKLETILIDEILNSKDQTALATKKDGIIRSMDKEEVRRVLNAILGVASQEVTPETGDDLLKLVIKMKQLISNYATDSVLLLGADVYDKYETYDLDNVSTFNYDLRIKEVLASMGINKVVKVIGTIDVGNTSEDSLLDAKKGILVGRDSNLAKGKPVKMIRRKFTGEIAQMAGAQEGAVRLVSVAKTPQPINGSNANTLGYSCFGYESVIQCITNYRALAWADFTSVI